MENDEPKSRNGYYHEYYITHRTKKKRLSHERYMYLISLGLCPNCKVEAEPGRVLCEKCRVRGITRWLPD